jgi:hypothetical protein
LSHIIFILIQLYYLSFFLSLGIGGQFAEDGSFIGQYIPGKPPVSPQPVPHIPPPPQQGGNAATYV